MRSTKGVCAAVVGAALGNCLSFVQEANSQVIDEVVVTAQRRAQSMQDVPISISAITGMDVERAGIISSHEIEALVPNLNIALPLGDGNQPVLFMRGVGLNDFSANNAGPIAIYVDDALISAPGAQMFQVFDLERIEVLRGPQGTLYGRNTTGGAIKFISRKPTFEGEGHIKGHYASYNETRIEGALSGPLSDDAAFRISAVKTDSSGTMRNLLTHDREGGADNFAFRTQLAYQPTTSLDINLSFLGGINHGEATQYRSLGVLDPNDGVSPCGIAAITAGQCGDALGYVDAPGFHKGSFNKTGQARSDTYLASLSVKWSLTDITLISESTYLNHKKLHEEDADASPNRLLEADYGANVDTITQEIRLNSTSDRLEWVVGLYYLNEDIETDQSIDVLGALRPLIEAVDPVLYPGGFDPDGVAIGAPAFKSQHLNFQQTETVAVFGQAEYRLSDQVKATAGLRYTYEKRTFDSSVAFVEPGFSIPIYDFADRMSGSEINWRGSLDYTVNDDVMIYGSAATAFKSGGYNGSFLFSPAEQVPFQPETVLSYEAGLKSTLFDRRLRLNAAVFYNDYKDLQVFTLFAGGAGVPVSVLTNAANAEMYGAELEVLATPMDGLTLQYNLGLLSSKLKNYQAGIGPDFSGNRTPFSPKITMSGTLRYEWLVEAVGQLAAQANVNYQGSHYFSTQNDPILRQKGFVLLDARLDYRSLDDQWGLALFGKNIFDKNYAASGFDVTDFGFYQLINGMPRIVGLELSLSF